MARSTFVYRPGHPNADQDGFVNKNDLYSMLDDMRGGFGNQSISVHVISDTMAHTRHMADGKYYDSKHKFRAATKAAGCIEVGNETKTLMAPRKPIVLSREQRRDDIRKAVYQIRNGRDVKKEFR